MKGQSQIIRQYGVIMLVIIIIVLLLVMLFNYAGSHNIIAPDIKPPW